MLADKFRGYLDYRLSVSTTADVVTATFAPVLRTKGAAHARHYRVRMARGQPELKGRWEALQGVNSRLAKLSFETPDPKRRDIWRRQLDDATREKESLEVKLMRKSASFRKNKELERLTPEQLTKKMQAETALVDFLEYRRYTPPAEGKGNSEPERHFLAFVVRPDQPIARVDLGPGCAVFNGD